MITEPLNAVRILVVATFSLVCFGLMLYLWNAFGGSVPFKPQGYRITVALPEADLLSTQADVRISGVSVGHVLSTSRTPSATDPKRKDAILEIDHQYAPLRRDVRAMIRRKSLLGEEFLELTPGTPGSAAIPDGGRMAAAQVAPSVEIDEILATFDAATRRSFETWIQEQAASIDGRGADLNAAFGNLPGFEADITKLLTTLNQQQGAVQAAVRNTGEVFDALSASRDALNGVIVNGKRATDAFAQQKQAFADVWRAFPPFERNSQLLLNRAEAFRRNADPVLTQLRPGIRDFSQTLQDTKPTAKELNGLMQALGPLTSAGERGLPASRKFVGQLRPFVAEWVPFLEQLNPLLGYIGTNPDSITTLLGNIVAVTQNTAAGYGSDVPLHYARASLVLNPGALGLYHDHQLPSNRSNAYPTGDTKFSATTPYRVFDNRNCGPLKWPTLAPAIPGTGISQDLIDKIRHFAFNDDQPLAPPCLLQTPSGPNYPRVEALSHTPGGAP